MSGLRRVAAAPARVRAALPKLLAALPDPLHPLVEQVNGLDGEIDLVARDARGRAVAVRLAAEGQDLGALADLLAQCDWLRPRLRDWLKLNPGLGVDPGLGVAGLLLAPEFGARTVALARCLGDSAVVLGRVSAFEWQGALELAVEPIALGLAAAPGSARAAAPEPPAREPADGRPDRLAELGPGLAALESRFRTGLRDEELGLPRRPRAAPRG